MVQSPLKQLNLSNGSDDLVMTIVDNFAALKKEILRVRKRIEQDNIVYPAFKPATIYGEKSIEEIDEILTKIDDFQQEFTRNNHNRENQGQTAENPSSSPYGLFCRLLARTLHKFTIYFAAYDRISASSHSLFDDAARVFNQRRCLYHQLCRADYPFSEKNELLTYELELAQRQRQFYSTVGGRHSLWTLKAKYSTTLTTYLDQCRNFHAHVYVINVDPLLNCIFADEQQHEELTRALKRLRIPLTFPNLRLHSNLNDAPEQSSNQNSFDSFIPSKAVAERRRRSSHVYVDTVIRDNRWTVLLGSPGSGKTTLARWLTHTFAQAVSQGLEQVSIGEGEKMKHLGISRLPILIRVSEFTHWLQRNPTSTLFDYMGQHTWHDQLYLKGKSDMIQDFVRHHHALIILDGLDAVNTFELRARILKLIHDFIESFVLSSDFISAYDDITLAKMWPKQVDRWEGLQYGNVIIMASSISGYDVQPVRGELIAHYEIVPMNSVDVSDFVTTWCANVQAKVISLLISFIPDLEETQSARIRDWLCVNALLKTLNSKKEITSWAANRRLLFALCTVFARQGSGSFGSIRVLLYEQVVDLVLQRWHDQESRIEANLLKYVLSQLALYIHLRSKSGLIDEFDLKTLCRLSLKQWSDENHHEYCSSTPSKLRYRTENFIERLNEDTGIIAAPYLGVYQFFHASFQEFFVSRSIITTNSLPNVLAARFCDFYSQPKMRGPLLLAMGKISLEWNSIFYDQFCDQLISYDRRCNKYVPLGALLLVASLSDLARLPSTSIVFNALDTLLFVDDDGPETCLFQSPISQAFNVLPVPIVQEWLTQVLFRNAASRLKIMLILWTVVDVRETLPRWIDMDLLKILWSCFTRFEEKVDVYIQKFLTRINMAVCYQRLEHMFQDLRSYLWAKHDVVAEMDPCVLAAIIVLYGGLQRIERRKQHPSVTFSPICIHRDSPLSPVFIEYFENTGDQANRIQRLIDRCHQTILAAAPSDVSLPVVHSFVVLLCLNGVSQPSNYCQYKSQNALQLAVRYLRLTRIYLHDYYIGMELYDAIDVNTLAKEITHDDKFVVFQLLAHAYGLLVCAKYCPHRILPAYRINQARLVNLKLPISSERRPFLEYNEAMRLTILSCVYCIPPRDSASIDDIAELEQDDVNLLKDELHPFQLLQDRPTLLLITYLPKHVQALYTHMLADCPPLPFVHLLAEFLIQIQYMEVRSLRLWILLTVLEPIFIKHNMMNFLRATIERAARTITTDSYVYLVETILKQSYVESLVNRLLPFVNPENQTSSMEAATVQDASASNDLDIYTASMNCDNLNDGDTSSTQAWLAIENIKDSLWKLHAFIVLSHTTASLKKKLRNKNYLLNELIEILERTEGSISFIAFIAVFVRYWPHLELISSTRKDTLISKIFDRMRTVSMIEQQAICQALAHFSYLRRDVCRFMRQSDWTNDIDALKCVFQINSIPFADLFRSSLLQVSTDTKLHVSSMYLSELAFDIQLLQDWLDCVSSESFVSNCTLSITPFEECLQELRKQIEVSDELRLSSTTVEKINTLLSSSFLEVEKPRILTLVQLLRQFNELKDESASLSIIQWLTWHSHSNLQPFAYHGALLLAQYGLWTSDILEICCELLTSNDDFYRRKAGTVIRAYASLDFHVELIVIIKWVAKWNTYPKETVIQVKECVRCSFRLHRSDEIDLIIQEERNRFDATRINKSRSSFVTFQIFFLDLIAEMTPEATARMNKIIHPLTNSNNPTDYRFFLWIISYRFISQQISNYYVDCLLNFLRNDYDPDVQVAAIRALIWCQENDYVRNILWATIRKNVNNNSSDIDASVLVACLWSLYFGRNKHIEEPELRELHSLRNSSTSQMIRRASLYSLYQHLVQNQTEYSVHEIYCAFIVNADQYLFNNGRQNHDDNPLKIAAQWIITHESALLSIFVQDTFKNMCNDEISGFEMNSTYIEVANLVCEEISNEFCRTVRESSFGEQSFKDALYKTSKNMDRYRQQYVCFSLYSQFKEITNEHVSMLMTLALEDNIESNSDYSLLGSLISKELCLYDRELVDYLLSMMTSVSLCQRFYAVKMLYHLVKIDCMSVIEFQQALLTAIEDPWSHQKSLHRFSKGQFDYELKLLLRRLLFSTYDNRQIQLPALEIFDKSISLICPTLLFSNDSNL